MTCDIKTYQLVYHKIEIFCISKNSTRDQFLEEQSPVPHIGKFSTHPDNTVLIAQTYISIS